jgi:hypothetical protein
MKNYRDSNYFNGVEYYNDSLNISAVFFGDIKFKSDLERLNFNMDSIKPYKKKSILLYGKSSEEYEIFLFLDRTKKQDSLKTRLVLNDKANQQVVYEKIGEKEKITVLLKNVGSKKSNATILRDGSSIINSIEFNSSKKKELTYLNIFNKYKNESNFLYAINKLDVAPIVENDKNKWMKFQLLTTLLSNDASNTRYKDNINFYEAKTKKRQQAYFDSILTKGAAFLDNDVISKISKLSKDTQVLMLNENHWKPNHRILAQKLLKPLKENGYNYLAVEAIDREKDSVLNKRKYPIESNGYYVKEPYFGLFIREALNLGFKIVGYDDFETTNRELTQAQNIKKIFELDKTAKVFVYAGIDHILENNPDKKRMAEYFKELTNINPITIDQVEIVADTKQEIVLSESKHFLKAEKVNTNVDYFLINNIPPSLNSIFDEKELSPITLKNEIFNNYINKDLLVSIYYQKEYYKYKSHSIPIINKIVSIKDNSLTLIAPVSSLTIKILDVENNIVLLENIENK